MQKVKSTGYIFFLPDQQEGVREYLEEQALKGWFPDSYYSGIGLMLTRGEPRKLKYYVTYAEPSQKNRQDEIWSYLGQFSKLHVYASETKNGNPPGSSEAVSYAAAKYQVWTGIIGPMALSAGAILFLWLLALSSVPRELLKGQGIMWSMILWIGMMLLLPVLKEGIWLFKNNHRQSRGKDIQWNGLRNARICSIFYLGVFFTGAGSFILWKIESVNLYKTGCFILIFLVWAITSKCMLDVVQQRRVRQGEEFKIPAERVTAVSRVMRVIPILMLILLEQWLL